MHPAVQVDQLKFTYPGSEKTILEDVSMRVDEGEFVCIFGQSGCGKSTFLRLLAGLETPTGGSISMFGETIKGAGPDRAVVFQDYGLFPWMTAGKNIVLALKQKFPDTDKAELKAKALEMLEAVGLSPDVFDKLPKELSGGMKQRCAIARAFGMDSPVMLMDEPFGALDAVTRARLQDLLLELWNRQEQRKTVFFVTHDVDEALLLASRIIVFGQSPAHAIYECRIDPDQHRSREGLFESSVLMGLRNDLIRHMNLDINGRID